MTILVRRSNLLAPLTDAGAVESAWRHNADAITLDLAGVEASRKAEVRRRIPDAIAAAKKGGAEIFVSVDKAALREDLAAAAAPGVAGIVLPNVDSVDEVTDADRAAPPHLAFIALLASARAVWDIRAILAASQRISQIGLNEPALAASLELGSDPIQHCMGSDPDFDPFVYARGRLAVEATAAKVPAIGMAYPLGAAPRELPAAEIQTLATTAKNLGMKGVLCPYASWVEPVNAAFTPTPELVHYNQRVREAFAAGVAAGTAAVPLDGRMIDVPVDEWAIVVLDTAKACAERDAQKRAALADHR